MTHFGLLALYWMAVIIVLMVAAASTSVLSGGTLPTEANYFFGPAFLVSPLVARVAYKYSEPRAARKALHGAMAATGADHGVILRPSLRQMLGVAKLWEHSAHARALQKDFVNAPTLASARLVAVRTANGLELRMGFSGEQLLLDLPDGRFRLGNPPGIGRLELLHPNGDPAAEFPIMRIRKGLLKPATIAEAMEVLDPRGAAPHREESLND